MLHHDLILGTAGHIDHGKTALVRALTGIDTDRLPEEKRRGITIQLGFALLELSPYRLGIVDVPGHERFVRQMLAGAAGMNLAMLVVAADDSVKPQTIEHLEILRQMRLSGGVVVLTKCDLADPQWLALVKEEVRELVQGSPLEDSPMIETSIVTGQGIEVLRAALHRQAKIAAAAISDESLIAPFRLPIDRAFTLEGHGTVVTGSVVSGTALVDSQLVLQPDNLPVRIRSMQNHDDDVKIVHRGQRAAINLAGVECDTIGRGKELVDENAFLPTTLLTVKLHVSNSAVKPLKHRARIRVHIGTGEYTATVMILSENNAVRGIESGQTQYAQLQINTPTIASWNQPFVLRVVSPVATIGGGVVLTTVAERIKVFDTRSKKWLQQLETGDSEQRTEAAIWFLGLRPWKTRLLSGLTGVDDVMPHLEKLLHRGQLVELRFSQSRSRVCHQDVVEEIARQISTVLARAHQKHPQKRFIERSQIDGRFLEGQLPYVHAILQRMADSGLLTIMEGGAGGGGGGVALAGYGAQLSAADSEKLQDWVSKIEAGKFRPPTFAELVGAATKQQQKAAQQLLEIAIDDGHLVRISSDLFLHAQCEFQLRQLVGDFLREHGQATVSDIRGILDSSRKYAVPICEYLDRIGFTKRKGDVRVR